MKNDEDKSTVQLLHLDLDLITDAVRRLSDGTCCLNNEDEIASARHLLYQSSGALQSHIDIEEKVFASFTKNPENAGFEEKFFQKMKAEHQHLKTVLQDVQRELDGQHAIAFHSVLKVFSQALQRHTQLENTIPYTEVLKKVDSSTLDGIKDRIDKGYVD